MSEDRLNSKLEWQGAEFLVLANLLIEKIEAYKPYVNHAGYDLVALNISADRRARISVKSRWATNRAGYFSVTNMDCDFVVHVALNRGERRRRRTIPGISSAPEIYVFPVKVCESVCGRSGRINIKKIRGGEQFISNWQLIREFLEPYGSTR